MTKVNRFLLVDVDDINYVSNDFVTCNSKNFNKIKKYFFTYKICSEYKYILRLVK